MHKHTLHGGRNDQENATKTRAQFPITGKHQLQQQGSYGTHLPMRPNPLIATLTIVLLGDVGKEGMCCVLYWRSV